MAFPKQGGGFKYLRPLPGIPVWSDQLLAVVPSPSLEGDISAEPQCAEQRVASTLNAPCWGRWLVWELTHATSEHDFTYF